MIEDINRKEFLQIGKFERLTLTTENNSVKNTEISR